MKKKKIILTVSIVFALFVLAWYISTYWVQLMLIQGNSMKPAYKNLQLVAVDKRNTSFKVDDVIVFKKKGIKGVLVKRVVARGDDIVLIKDGFLYVNGEKSECQLKDSEIEYAGIAEKEIVIPKGCFFVLGDNYQESKDSRYEEIGLVLEDDIVGRIID